MKRKYINGEGWGFLEKFTSKFIHIEGSYTGYISYVKVHKIKHVITVDYKDCDIPLFDSGYKCIVFLPDSENWCVSAVYDKNNRIVEWYFDITKLNTIDENKIPVFDDLYLDIAISPDLTTTILDEDELDNALSSGDITQSDYNIAYKTCENIITKYVPKKAFMVDFLNYYLKEFESNRI